MCFFESVVSLMSLFGYESRYHWITKISVPFFLKYPLCNYYRSIVSSGPSICEFGVLGSFEMCIWKFMPWLFEATFINFGLVSTILRFAYLYLSKQA